MLKKPLLYTMVVTKKKKKCTGRSRISAQDKAIWGKGRLVHNIIQIHNSLLWDWHYSKGYCPYHTECLEYSTEYCLSRITMLRIWIMLCILDKMGGGILERKKKCLNWRLGFLSKGVRLPKKTWPLENFSSKKILAMLASMSIFHPYLKFPH